MDTEKEGRANTKAKRGKAHPAAGTGKGPFSEAPFEVPRERESHPDGDRGPTRDGLTQETGSRAVLEAQPGQPPETLVEGVLPLPPPPPPTSRACLHPCSHSLFLARGSLESSGGASPFDLLCSWT